MQSLSLGGSRLLARADRLGPKVGGCPVLVLHSSNEPDELLHWPPADPREGGVTWGPDPPKISNISRRPQIR